VPHYLSRQEVKRLKDHGEESILLQGRWLLLKKVATMLRSHKAFILNWFRAGGELSSGVIEGFKLKGKLTMRKVFGFWSL